MSLAAQVVLWISLYAVVYAYFVYPVLIFICSRLLGSKPKARQLASDELPRVSLLIAALNEDSVIRERVENALALDYPADKLEIVIASDGSVDRTAEIVRKY